MSIQVTVLGGSGVATPELSLALREIPNRTQPVQLVLHGRTPDKLEHVAAAARALAGDDALISVRCTTDLDEALSGADYILNQVRVGGLEARLFDETFPQELGIPGEETVGAGGFANALRTLPAVLATMRRAETLCPGAKVLSFVNPASLIQYAIARYTRLETLGMCDAPVTFCENIARALGLPLAELTIDYIGMHHFGWVNGVWHRGRDLLPEALRLAEQIAPDVDPTLVRAMGVLPGAYHPYFFHPERMLARKMGKRPRAAELIDLQAEILNAYTNNAEPAGGPPAALRRRGARWYSVVIAPVLAALIETAAGSQSVSRHILNVRYGSTLGWLPPDAIIETPCVIQDGACSPLGVRPLPPDVTARVQLNSLYERLVAEAIVEHDRAKALRALALNPVIGGAAKASAVLDLVWQD